MQDVRRKINYIYYVTDGLYYFLSNPGISDFSKRCFLRRFFVLFDSYLEYISFFKNELFRINKIDAEIKRSLDNELKDIRREWESNYELVRNKLSAHQQYIDELDLQEWWSEIDFSTISFFYEGMSKVRLILTQNNILLTITPTDYEDIDFSGTCLQENDDSSFYVAHDRLALTKKNTVGMIATSDFQRKCMLLLSTVDFLFIDFEITLKTQNYSTNYKGILFNTAWLLVVCDTTSLIDNLYEESTYGSSLINVCPNDWKGKSIIEQGDKSRDFDFENKLRNLRNKFAAHIDSNEGLSSILDMFRHFELQSLHEYCMYHMRVFQQACSVDIRSNMFCSRDQEISGDIIGLSHTGHKSIDK